MRGLTEIAGQRGSAMYVATGCMILLIHYWSSAGQKVFQKTTR
jgi:hypothetical protein